MGTTKAASAQAIVIVSLCSGACSEDPSAATRDSPTSPKNQSADCPPPSDLARIAYDCALSTPPTAKTTGACTAAQGTGTYIDLQSTGAGVCHTELTDADGGTSSIDVTFIAKSRPLGDDPQGCGQEFVPISDAGIVCIPSACQFSLPGSCAAGSEH
jgi:hypothetical protein